MRLCTYDIGTGPRAGVVVDDAVLDVAALLSEARVTDVRALLELPDEPLTRLSEAVQAADSPASTPLADVRLLAPVLQPPTIRDFMVYEGHASAAGSRTLHEAWYRLPVFYFSNTLRIFGPAAEVPCASASDAFDYELEIGAVIGREGSNLSRDEALDYIAGFTIFNDWSCRDLQMDESQVGLGPAKAKDSASSLGPVVVTVDELAPVIRDGQLHVDCRIRVNGTQWMENNAGIMHHDWGAILERASRDSRIVPGDVIGSGTVTGGTVGEAIRGGYDARYLRPGDEVELEVEGIGILRNTLGNPPISADRYPYRTRPGLFQPPARPE